MHRNYKINVKANLLEGENVLRVVFESPIRKGLELYDELGYRLPVSANDQAETGQVPGGKRINVHTRKAAYHYGWDWGPRLVSSGIWRPVSLISWDHFRINELSLSQQMMGDVAQIRTHITIESNIESANGLLEIRLDDQTVVESKHRLVKGVQHIDIPMV